MSRFRIALVFLPVLLILLLAGAFGWLLHSESGAAWVWQRVVAAVPGTLQAQGVSGDLRSGLNVEQLSYRDPGLALTADRVALRFELDFWPPGVSVHHVSVGELNLQSTGESPQAETAVADWLPRLALPVPVQFKRVEFGRVTWSSAGAEPRIDIHDLSLSGSWHRRLVLREAHLESGGSRWRAALDLDLQAPHRLEFKAAGAAVLPGQPAGVSELPIRARASGDLEKSQWLIEAADPQVTLSGEVRGLLAEPDWNLRLTAEQIDWPPAPADPVLFVHDLVVDSQGTLAAHNLQAVARVLGNGLSELQVRVLGAGDRAGVDVERVELAGEALQLDAAGRVDWLPAVNVRMDATVSRFDPQPWFAGWNDEAPVSGRVAIGWSAGRLEFEILEAAAPGTLAALAGSGVLDSSGSPAGILDAELTWQGLVWPPGAAEPRVSSREGRARIGGTLDAWTVGGELELSGPDFPTGRLQAEGTGDRESLSLRVPRGEVLGGTLAGAFDLRWSPAVSWSATARLENVATAPLAPSFPGRLSGELAVSGRPQPEELQIDIKALAGTVRDRPVRASGRLVLEAGRLAARGLQIASGSSEVTADGQLDEPAGLALTARIASLSDLADGASGSFEGSATVSLDPSRPLLRLNGSGRELSWGETAIGQLTVSTEAADGDRIQLELSELEVGGRHIDSVRVTAAGVRPLERLQAELKFGEGMASLSAVGGLQNWRAPLQGGWRGRLEALRVEEPALGHVALQQPAALSLDAGGLELAEACFDGSQEGRLCVQAAWRPGRERTLQASLDNVSPNFALRLFGADFAFSQRLSGVVEWLQRPGSAPVALVRLDVTPGELGVHGEEEAILVTGAGLFGFEVAEGRLYAGKLYIPLAGAEGIDADFNVPDLSQGLDSPVQGRLRVDLDTLEPLLRLLPYVAGSSGPVTADLRFSGTLANPRLTGHASLVRGRLSHFASGLRVEDVTLAGAVFEYDQTEFTGTFRAGTGQGSVRAVVNFADLLRPEILLEVAGENLTLIDVPDLKLRADPDVRLTWRQGELELQGRVVVPSARLSPRYLPTASATESADVVIVAGEDPLAEVQARSAPATQIRGELELVLGDDVQLRLDKATARLSGTTTFRWAGPLVPMASGGFGVTGEIKAYGQLLEVTEGRINFSERPADNPFLNIRAEREIYGNTQVRRAGVMVSGTLKRPDFETYTVPMTTRERALTLLVTGSDFNYEQGMGSVEVGMYVAPKLYISYGIGLFDEQNVISARYDLGKGFGVKTTSGQRETGADISYTIEH